MHVGSRSSRSSRYALGGSEVAGSDMTDDLKIGKRLWWIERTGVETGDIRDRRTVVARRA